MKKTAEEIKNIFLKEMTWKEIDTIYNSTVTINRNEKPECVKMARENILKVLNKYNIEREDWNKVYNSNI